MFLNIFEIFNLYREFEVFKSVFIKVIEDDYSYEL